MIKTNPVLLAHEMFTADEGIEVTDSKSRVYAALQAECEAMEILFDEGYASKVLEAYETEKTEASHA